MDHWTVSPAGAALLDRPLKVYTTEQVAEILSTTRQYIYELARTDPTFPACRIGRGYRFEEEALRAWLQGPGHRLAGGWKHASRTD